MDTRTFTVTPAQLTGLSVWLKGHGLTLDPTAPAGHIAEDGWDLVWSVADDQLAVTVNKHPFAQEGFFWSKLQNILAPS